MDTKELREKALPAAWDLIAPDGGHYILSAQGDQQPQGWAKATPLYSEADVLSLLGELDRLRSSSQPMADGGEKPMTAAEEVLAWLLVEKIGVPDDVPYSPVQAQEIIAARITELYNIQERLFEAEEIIKERDDRLALVDRIADLIGLPHDQELDQVEFELWFSRTRSSNEAMRKALEPFARLEVPKKPVGNAGAYSLRFSDIETAREALSSPIKEKSND